MNGIQTHDLYDTGAVHSFDGSNKNDSPEENFAKYFVNENDVLFINDTGKLGKRKLRVLLSGVEPKTIPITSPDPLPLSYRRLVGAKAIKLEMSMDGICAMDRNVME